MTYKTLNKNIQDYTVNATNLINEIAVGSTENFVKAIELTQRYYNDIVENNFNYARKIESFSSKLTSQGKKKIFKYCVYNITPSPDYVFGRNQVLQNCNCKNPSF